MTTGTYKCAGCGTKIGTPEGLCKACAKELKELLRDEERAKKLKDSQKRRKKGS